ncbi:MAG: argininosuccinate lyase [Polyangiaceae bacterium]|nr:argininosuccinate lyase [Polyangiaceae bacterium]
MSGRLWDKGEGVDRAMLRYTARDDWQLDQRLLPHDLRASVAHVRGLGRIGVLAPGEVDALVLALEELLRDAATGAFVLTPDDEDGHTAIETALVRRLGDVGRKVHTGRSRNDQVLVALRLYEREALADLAEAARLAALALCETAEREALTPMPGYTHLQRAVPSSVGLWLSAVAEGLADARDHVQAMRELVDRSPLGAAAGYGVNLPLDRAGVAAELGFAGVADNPLASQSSRGIHEVAVLGAAWHVCAVLRRFAWDLSFFTTSEAGFVRLDPALTTGSSIMPNKRNPDLVELMRASCAVVQGASTELQTLVALPSGYHRDLQLTKAPLMRGLDEALATTRLVPRLVAGLGLDHARMLAAVTPECFATDRAVELAVAGVPFREAYRRVAGELDELGAGDAGASLRARVSPGAPGALALEALRRRLAPRPAETGG